MKLAKYSRVCLPEWIYLGGEMLTPAAATVQANLPADATIVDIRAAGGDVYYSINNNSANTNSPGYIADGGGAILGPVGNLTRLAIYAGAGASAHIQYWREG